MAKTSVWKSVERELARLLGGERVPVTGRARGNAPDIRHPYLAIEVKHRKMLPEWLHDAMRQAVASVRGLQLPIVILHQSRSRHDDDFVVIRMSDFRAWMVSERKEKHADNTEDEKTD